MAAVELATAYITIVPSAMGIKSAVEKELTGLDSVGAKAGGKAAEGFGSSFKGKAKDLAAGAGVAASTALAVGFSKNLDISAGNDKLAAQLGLTGAEAKAAGDVAAKVYSGAWGESLAEVNGAVAQVMSTLGSFGVTGAKDVEGATKKALDFAKAFDTDIAVAVGNAGILLETGLAKNSNHAFDLMVAGMQKVPVAFQDEFGEATKEYSQFFAGLGFSGEEAMGVLAEASKGGQYMVDKVGDSVKEFTIKVRDGNKETSKALAGIFGGTAIDTKTFDKVIGKVDVLKEKLAKAKLSPATPESAANIKALTAELGSTEKQLATMRTESTTFQTKFQQLTADMAAGGPRAKAAFTEIANGIAAIKDPVEKSQAAIAIFGVPFEDISGDATKMNEVLKNLAGGGLPDVAGAADKMSETLNTNTSSTIESLKRRFELATAGIAGVVGPIGVAAPALGGMVTTMGAMGPAFSKAGELAGKLAGGLRGATVASIAHKVATVAGTAATTAASVATGIFNAVMALNPIVLVVLAIAALVAGLILAYHKVGWFRDFVDGAFRLIGTVVGAVVGFIKDHWQKLLLILTGPIGLAVMVISKHWNTIKAAVGAVVGFIRQHWQTLLAIITGPIGLAILIITKNWDTIKAGFGAVVGFIRDRIGDVVGFFTGLKDKIVGIARGIFEPILDAWKGIVNAIIGAWNRIDFGINVQVPDWVPGVGGKGFKIDDLFPDIPNMATGGIVPATPGGTIIRVAEGGRDEAIIPLARGLEHGRGGDTWNITTPHVSPLAAARAIADEQAWRRRTAAR